MRSRQLATATLLPLALALTTLWFYTVSPGPLNSVHALPAAHAVRPQALHPLAPAGTIHVDTEDDVLNTAYPNGDCSLREAMINANTDSAECPDCEAGTGDDTIILPAGTYQLTLTESEDEGRQGDLDVTDTDRLTIQGAGAADTVIDANGIDRALDIHAGAGAVVISGLTVINGQVSGQGGGIYVGGASLTLTDVHIRDNAAGSDGGGIYVDQSTAQLIATRVEFRDNTAEGDGGGLFVQAGAASLTDPLIVSNRATSGGGIAVGVTDGQLTTNGGVVQGNVADNDGGGLYVDAGNATFTDTQIRQNTAGDGGGICVNRSGGQLHLTGGELRANAAEHGGGAYVRDGAAALTETHVISNAATGGLGGGLWISSGQVSLTDAHILRNTANSSGGGLYVGRGTATVRNSHIVGNATEDGGGVYVWSGTAAITGSKIITNTATDEGGGLFVWGGSATLTDGNIDGNVSSQGGALYLESRGAITVSQSCITNNSDTAVYNDRSSGNTLVARQNWWGATSGPSKQGPGSGDSVGTNVAWEGFKTTPPPACPCDLVIEKSAQRLYLDSGDPITYTINFSNRCRTLATDVVITDVIPVTVTRASLGYASSGAAIFATGTTQYTWDAGDLGPSAGGVITVTGVLSEGLADGYAFDNTALLGTSAADDAPGNNHSTVTVTIGEPRIDVFLPLVARAYATPQ